jgi:hypothetical protein
MGNLALFISPWDSDLFSNVYFTFKKKESLNNLFCHTFYFVMASSFSLKFDVNFNNIKTICFRTTENALCLLYKDSYSMVFRRENLLFVVRVLRNLQMHYVEKNVELSLLQKVVYVVSTYTLGFEQII